MACRSLFYYYEPNNALPAIIASAIHTNPLIRKNRKAAAPNRFSHRLHLLSCLGSSCITNYSTEASALWAPSQIGIVKLIPQRHSETFSRFSITVPSSSIMVNVPVILTGPRGFNCIVAPSFFSSSNNSSITGS